jgi:hypothetical protein
VDTSVYFKHLKGANDKLFIGEKPMQLWIERNGKRTTKLISPPKEELPPIPKINPLLCCPSPRDIDQVYDELKNTGYDRLYAKYFPEKIAYTKLRDWFIEHTQYTHLVICPDDLVIKKEHLDQLIKDLEESNYAVLSGVCNVDNGVHKDFLNVTENLPHPTKIVPERNQIGWRWYSWVHQDTIFPNPITSFWFSGFACMIIRRDVVNRIGFMDDATTNGTPDLITGAIDVMFANTCAMEKIPQMVDTRVRMEHLKGKERFFDIILGDGELRLYPANKDMYYLYFKEEANKQRVWRMTGGEVVEGMVLDAKEL